MRIGVISLDPDMLAQLRVAATEHNLDPVEYKCLDGAMMSTRLPIQLVARLSMLDISRRWKYVKSLINPDTLDERRNVIVIAPPPVLTALSDALERSSTVRFVAPGYVGDWKFVLELFITPLPIH